METNDFYMLTHPHPLKIRSKKTSWFCDLSVQLSGCMSGLTPSNHSLEDRYVCTIPGCLYAACLKCYQHYKCNSFEMPGKNTKNFSRIHSHELTENIGKSWNCDGRKFYTQYEMTHDDGKEKRRYSCRNCDFDLCPSCFLSSFDCRAHISTILLKRAGTEKKSTAMIVETFNVLEQNQSEGIDELRARIKALEIENHSLKEELKNIKALIFEIQEELTEFKKELTGEMRDILIKYAGSALGIFDLVGGAVSSLGDILTIIPGIGQIAGALKLVYSACSSPVKAVSNKIKADRIKRTLDKLDKLKAKLDSIQ